MATNKDIDTFQSQFLVTLIQVRQGLLTLDQAIAAHQATMDPVVAQRVTEQLAPLVSEK